MTNRKSANARFKPAVPRICARMNQAPRCSLPSTRRLSKSTASHKIVPYSMQKCSIGRQALLGLNRPMNQESINRTNASNRNPRLPLVAGLFLVFALALTGCSVVNKAAKLPGQAVTTVVTGAKSAALDPATIQAEVLRFSDDY